MFRTKNSVVLPSPATCVVARNMNTVSVGEDGSIFKMCASTFKCQRALGEFQSLPSFCDISSIGITVLANKSFIFHSKRGSIINIYCCVCWLL